MSDGTLGDRVRATVRKVAPALAPDFSATADIYRELGVKSVAALDLLLSLEEEFGVSIADDAFGDARSVDALTTLITGLQGGA